jgi:hypothetical protein
MDQKSYETDLIRQEFNNKTVWSCSAIVKESIDRKFVIPLEPIDPQNVIEKIIANKDALFSHFFRRVKKY